ncbi:MAG: prepilin-type N-terminal cleavage/methylation domain-containing protein [Alphaproteobacteria bacterium]|nr:prepilin-type N-terminal cleavage/methylation domain-containing protein [Alphaproteobacteria bacterium]
MTQSTNQAASTARRNESGFTLVELAIVMIIIGLLIGGILKGQELITNARVSSTVAQVKAIESGISGFRDKYAAFPGDLANPGGRLPSCTVAPCNGVATGGTLANGFIEPQNPGGTTVLQDEASVAFIHLAAAGLIGGVQPTATALGAGRSHPTTPLGGTWAISSFNGTATGVVNANGVPAGVYVLSKQVAPGTITTADNVQNMTPSSAANIDRKLDDGVPTSGQVRAVGGNLNAANCASGPAGGDIYNESLSGTFCNVMARVQ